MPRDKSLFFYGSLYHALIDPPLEDVHHMAVELLPMGSSVLDIACGTGTFALMAKKIKGCHVEGLDLSLKMLEFARRSNIYPEVTFHHQDATDLRAYADGSFDFATILMMIHELARPQQVAVLSGALRVAKNVILIDSASPAPKNPGAILNRVVEATIGRDHYPNFIAFHANGGIDGILKDLSFPINVSYHLAFSHNIREVFVLTKAW